MMKKLLSYFGWFKWLPLTVALMSGPLSIARESYFLYSGAARPSSVFWTFTWIAFVISSAISWFQEHTQVLALQKRIAGLNSSEKIRGEWLVLKERFYGGFQPSIYAGWDRRLGEKELRWSFAGGWDSSETRMFEALVQEGGNLASRSPYCRAQFPELLKHPEAEDRWMRLVCAITNTRIEASAKGVDHDVHIEGGMVKDIVRLSLLACSLLSAKEASSLVSSADE